MEPLETVAHEVNIWLVQAEMTNELRFSLWKFLISDRMFVNLLMTSGWVLLVCFFASSDSVELDYTCIGIIYQLKVTEKEWPHQTPQPHIEKWK